VASSTRNRTPRLAVLGQSVRRPASSPLTSRSGSALRRRIVVVSLAVLSLALITISFRESDAGPVHGVQNAGATVLRPFEVATDRVARPFRDAYGWFHGLLNARSENDRLRKENAQLRQQYVAARSAVTRVAVLERLLEFNRGPDFPKDFEAVNAGVLASSTQFRQRITIAAGSNKGIRKDDPVVTDAGLIGKVTRVLSNVAQVTLLSDPTSAVPAKDLSSEASGVIRHSAGGGSALFFDRVPKNQVVRVNDVIVTAGTQLGALPDIYPSGIQIGWVSSSGQSDTEPFKTIQVEPFADLSSLDAVAVLIPKGRRR
jgi:rod shape-determining protein MreC